MKARSYGLSIVWLLLVSATIVSWSVGSHLGTPGRRLSSYAAAALLVVAFLKASFVMAYFMELRWAPDLLRGIALIWALVLCGALVWIYAT